MVNKIGDIALLLGIILPQYLYKSVTLSTFVASAVCLFTLDTSVDVTAEQLFSVVYSSAELYTVDVHLMPIRVLLSDTGTVSYLCNIYDSLHLVCVCVLFAAIGKSAQAGLHL